MWEYNGIKEWAARRSEAEAVAVHRHAVKRRGYAGGGHGVQSGSWDKLGRLHLVELNAVGVLDELHYGDLVFCRCRIRQRYASGNQFQQVHQ